MSLFNQHILTVSQFERESLRELFLLADKARKMRQERRICKALDGYVLGNVFFEASTRSRMSFSSAFQYLGGTVNSTNSVVFSSMSKGESLVDTLNVIPLYCDVMVVRHPELGSVAEAAKYSKVPVINAGDGPGEHPTQALLDLYTIYQEREKVDGLKIAFVGDLRFGRTIHSLTKLLCLYKDIKFIFAAPQLVQLPEKVLNYVRDKGFEVVVTEDFHQSIKEADVIYSTRIQRERFDNTEEYAEIDGKYVLNKKIVQENCKQDVTILHPLPRTNEIDVDLDELQNAAYFRQAEYGLYVRMALFLSILGKSI